MTLSFSWTDSEGSAMRRVITKVLSVLAADGILTFAYLDKKGKEQKDFRMFKELTSWELQS